MATSEQDADAVLTRDEAAAASIDAAPATETPRSTRRARRTPGGERAARGASGAGSAAGFGGASGGTARAALRILEQPGFVLHSYPYRETSLIIDVLTRDHGRVALVAKGAKRPHSALRGVLQTFQPLSLGWSGRSEMRTLTGAEWVGGMLPLTGDALVCGFYVNELLVRFCAREDPHPTLFKQYAVTLARLAHDEPAVLVLRSFERMLLRETGYAVAFSVNPAYAPEHERPRPDAWYVFDPERGARLPRPEDPDTWPRVLGSTLIDMEADDYSAPRTLSQSKTLMRFLLNYHLGGTPLNTRQILLDLQKL